MRPMSNAIHNVYPFVQLLNRQFPFGLLYTTYVRRYELLVFVSMRLVGKRILNVYPFVYL